MSQLNMNALELPRQAAPWTYIKSVFKSDWPVLRILIALVAIWFILAQSLTLIFPDSSGLHQSSGNYAKYVIRNGQMYLMFVMMVLAYKVFKLTSSTEKGQSALPVVKKQAQAWWQGPRYELLGVPGAFLMSMVLFGVFLLSYSTIKTRIPNLHPYAFDTLFYKLDRMIFLGRDPWTYFSFLYNHPVVIRLMDFIYDFWAAILVSCWFFALRYGGADKSRRYQFVLALLLTWFIGGNLMAIFLSSGGPVYYEALTGLPSTYSDQMAALSTINAETPLRAFEYQKLLWDIYQSPSVGLGGISAMPSMHCGSAFLLYLMFGRGLLSRLLLGGFFLMIFISSFVLAWHYALDGLFVLPVTYGCWRLAGFLVRKSGLEPVS